MSTVKCRNCDVRRDVKFCYHWQGWYFCTQGCLQDWQDYICTTFHQLEDVCPPSTEQ